MDILIEEYGGMVIVCLAVMISAALLMIVMYKYQSYATLLFYELMCH